MSNNDQLLVEATRQLIAAWEQLYTVEEVACDEEKVELLNRVYQSCGGSSAYIPDSVRAFYEEVYLRDVWAKNGSG